MRTAEEMYDISANGEENLRRENEVAANKMLDVIDDMLVTVARTGEYSSQVSHSKLYATIGGSNKFSLKAVIEIVIGELRSLGYYAKNIQDESGDPVLSIGWFDPKSAR